ncbi:MAG: type II toxin-antitoxin system VapC family toxin [Azospirillaceae bacterium]|nr:type II toxin-antitoxin system VapC family toxin [Azospirillaceae bacterium]
MLLDTHALLWLLTENLRLESAAAADLVTDPANDVFVSFASLWEITVKQRIGKIDADLVKIIDGCRRSGLQFLEIAQPHLSRLASLPVVEDHRDPFDHLLIAQAIAENLTDDLRRQKLSTLPDNADHVP